MTRERDGAALAPRHIVQLSRDRAVLDRSSESFRRQRAHADELVRMAPGSHLTLIVIGADVSSLEEPHLTILARPLSMTRGWLALSRTLRQIHASRPIGLVTTQTISDEAWAALAFGIINDIPVLGQAHSPELFAETAPRRRLGTLRLAFALRALPHFTGVRAVGEELGRRLMNAGAREVSVIPVVMPLVGEESAPSSSARERRVLFVGRLAPEKRLDRWLDTARLVKDSCPDARFDIVGDGALRPELEARARALGLSECVRFHGAIPNAELPSLYSQSTVLLLTSDFEGFGRVLAEAAAFECPAVAPRMPGVEDIVIDGETGLLASENDASTLAPLVVRILRDEAFRRTLGSRASRRIRERFAPGTLRERWIKLLLSAGSPPPPASPALLRSRRLLMFVFDLSENSQVLSWQKRVLEAIAPAFESVLVVTERYDGGPLPANVKALVLPRSLQRGSRFLHSRWLFLPRLRSAIRAFRPDICFFHMNVQWAYRVHRLLTRLRIPSVMWYAHGTVTRRLHLALRCVDLVLTSSPEGFRIPSPKVRVIGQAIDLSRFPLRAAHPVARNHLVTVGRISERKGIHLLIEALTLLRNELGGELTLEVIGAPLSRSDRAYRETLERRVLELGLQGAVVFSGARDARYIAEAHQRAALHVNVSGTGSMDKTVLEALACGCPVVTSNEAFRNLLSSHRALFVDDRSPRGIAINVAEALRCLDSCAPGAMRSLVTGAHDFPGYIERTLAAFAGLIHRREGRPL